MIRRAWAHDRVLTALFLVLAVASVLPIWIGRYLPLLDLPNHLSAIAIWHHEHDPRFDFDHYYRLNKALLPYWAHYYTVHLLAYLVPVEIGNKLFLTAYALALPVAVLLAARRWNRSPWLALFAFPLVWNFNLADGFIAYCAGIAVAILGLVVVDRHCLRPRLRSAAAVIAIGSALYFFHILPYVFFLVAAGLIVYAQPQPFRWRHILFRGLPVVLCCVVGLWAWKHQQTMGFARTEGTRDFRFELVPDALAGAPSRLLNFLASSRDEWVLVVLAISWLAVALTAARDREPSGSRFDPRSIGPELCFAVAALAVFLLPRSMHKPFNWYMINGRFAFVAALFGVLLIRGPVRGWRRWLFAPVAAAGLFYLVDVARMVVVFNRHVDGFDDLVAQIPLHRATITLAFPPRGDPQINVHAFNQWASYTQLRRGGYNFYNFNYGFPLRYIRYKPAPVWSYPQYFNFASMGSSWDYFLTHNEGVQMEVFPPLAKEGKVRLVGERGPWKLWQRVGEPAPEGPISEVPVSL